MSAHASTVSIFGRTLAADPSNSVTQIDNRTVIISPLFNTTGLTELKIGLFLPFSQTTNQFTQQIVWGGSSAIRMAVNEINARRLIPGAYVTLIEKDSFPDTSVDQAAVTNAVYSLVTLLQQGVIGVIGDVTSSWTALSALVTSTLQLPQCSFTAASEAFSDKTQYGYFFRTIPTDVVMIDALLHFVAHQGWSKVGVIYTDDSLGQQLYQRMIQQCEQMNIELVNYQSFPAVNASADAMTNALVNVTTNGARVLVVAAVGQPQTNLIMQAAQAGYMTSDYAWLLVDDTISISLPAALTDANSTLTMASNFNGLFWIGNWLTPKGYGPYDAFLSNWNALNASVYPEAGSPNISTNEGLAYSCMMMMAEGFKNIVIKSNNRSGQLSQLAAGNLDQDMQPAMFNVGYVGPNGPMLLDNNGDMMTGNYHIFNNQHGTFATVATYLIGQLTMNAAPMFFDGTSQIPSDSPPTYALNPQWTSVISFFILIITGTGFIFATAMFCLVIFYRKHPVFKAASPLFCCLELVGFVLTYMAVTLMIGDPTPTTCILMPVTFNLGFLLVLSNMIAKNYRIYRIFNNILIRRTVITDAQLIKSVTVMVTLELIIVITGLFMVKPSPVRVFVSLTSYYWSCDAGHPYTTVFGVLVAIYLGILLIIATFLAYKTRLAGKQYERYSECRQMGLSIYNILFCCLVAFVITINPMADYYTKYYISVVSALWATTFSLFILFLPILLAFFRQQKREQQKTQRSQQQSLHHQTSSTSTAETSMHSQQRHMPLLSGDLVAVTDASHPSLSSGFTTQSPHTPTSHHGPSSYHATLSSLPPHLGRHGHGSSKNDAVDAIGLPLDEHDALATELLSLDEILGSGAPVLRSDDATSMRQRLTELAPGQFLYEGNVPVRKVFRYLPWLAPWQMVHLMAFPGLGYITTISKQGTQGFAMAYDHATIESDQSDTFIIKVRGRGYYDFYIQVPSWKHLERWHQRLNHASGSYLTASSIPSSHDDLVMPALPKSAP